MPKTIDATVRLPATKSKTGSSHPSTWPRPLLSTVRKDSLGWKYFLLKIAIAVFTVLLMIGCGAGVFAGMRKLERHRRLTNCGKLKRQLLLDAPEMRGIAEPTADYGQKRDRIKLDACYQQLDAAKPPSTFSRAVWFAYSIFATIGHGTVAPRSWTILYACVSIPIFFAYEAKWCHYYLMRSYEELRRRCGAGKRFILTTQNPEDGRLFTFSLAILVAYLSIVSALYSILQRWPFWTSFYFAFRSVAMIGFGVL